MGTRATLLPIAQSYATLAATQCVSKDYFVSTRAATTHKATSTLTINHNDEQQTTPAAGDPQLQVLITYLDLHACHKGPGALLLLSADAAS